MQTDTIQNRITKFIHFITELTQSQIILNYNVSSIVECEIYNVTFQSLSNDRL